MTHDYHFVFLLLLCIWWSSNGSSLGHSNNNNDNNNDQNERKQSSTNQICQRILTYDQIISLLVKTPCLFIEKQSNINHNPSINGRIKRDVTAGNVDIHAIQTTINDHRTMINYLMNNSINFTVLADTINDHHSRTGPILSSWRDNTLLLFHVVLFIAIIYFFCCCIRCRPMDNMLRWVLQPINNRLQTQQQETVLIENKTHKTKADKQQQEPISSISRDMSSYRHQHHLGYMSD